MKIGSLKCYQIASRCLLVMEKRAHSISNAMRQIKNGECVELCTLIAFELTSNYTLDTFKLHQKIPLVWLHMISLKIIHWSNIITSFTKNKTYRIRMFQTLQYVILHPSQIHTHVFTPHTFSPIYTQGHKCTQPNYFSLEISKKKNEKMIPKVWPINKVIYLIVTTKHRLSYDDHHNCDLFVRWAREYAYQMSRKSILFFSFGKFECFLKMILPIERFGCIEVK